EEECDQVLDLLRGPLGPGLLPAGAFRRVRGSGAGAGVVGGGGDRAGGGGGVPGRAGRGGGDRDLAGGEDLLQHAGLLGEPGGSLLEALGGGRVGVVDRPGPGGQLAGPVEGGEQGGQVGDLRSGGGRGGLGTVGGTDPAGRPVLAAAREQRRRPEEAQAQHGATGPAGGGHARDHVTRDGLE